MAESTGEVRPWADRFLDQLCKYGTVAGAAKAAKVGRSTVYEELRRNEQFAADVKAVQDECVELVEATLFQAAMDLAGPTRWRDRLTYLKARSPELYGDKLRADQIAEVKAETRAEVMGELQRQILELTPEARDLVVGALGKAVEKLTAKELSP